MLYHICEVCEDANDNSKKKVNGAWIFCPIYIIQALTYLKCI